MTTLTETNFFYKQSGFRSLHSVVFCLLNCTSDWYININKGQYTATIFIELKKAFDTIDHEIQLTNWRSMELSALRIHALHLNYVTECSFAE